eukprot:GGOE01043507.1.p1 GENE.GGOE01043507.1~~GGOE01043507.1.p1  ORF type:complete len:641 (-),score=168.33 GGOE01043507.1:99-1880(-)
MAAVYLRLELWPNALEAAMACLALLPDDAKAKYRVAQALIGLNSFVAAWIWLRTVCGELLRPKDGSKATEWLKLELQCMKGLCITLLHEAVDIVEVSPGRFHFVCTAAVPEGTVLLQEGRYCRNREQDNANGGLRSAVRFITRIRDEGGLAKYERELRGLPPAGPSQLSTALWEEACAIAREELKAPTTESEASAVALLALQYNCCRFEDSLYRLSSLLCHSCAPTCDRVDLPNHDVSIIALQPITTGQLLSMNVLPIEGMLAGVEVRQHLLFPRLDGPCHCERCEVDFGHVSGTPTGEMVKCAAEGCLGYSCFPLLHRPEGSSQPCPQCGTATSHDDLSVQYTALRDGLQPFIPPLYLCPSNLLPPKDSGEGQVSALQGLHQLQGLHTAGAAFLHAQHHLMRLLHYASLRMAHAAFSVQYEEAFSKRGVQKASPDEFMLFIGALEDLRLLHTAQQSLLALTKAQGTGTPPIAAHCHALKEFHALVVDTVCVFAAERHVPSGYGSLGQLEAIVQTHLPHCTAKVKAAANQVLEVLHADDAGELASAIEAEKSQEERRAQRRELDMGGDDKDEEEAIAELLNRISAKMKVNTSH